MHERYADCGRRIAEGSVLRISNSSATTVRVRHGHRLVTDGPFAETAEQIAGIGIVDVPDLDVRWR